MDAESVSNDIQVKKNILECQKYIAKKKVEEQKSLFKILKKELFDSKVNKNGKFRGSYHIKSRYGNTIFYANVDLTASFEYRDKQNEQRVTFEDINKDGNFEIIHIFGDDGSCIIGIDKNEDGIFDIYHVEYKNKERISFEEK